MDNDKVGCAGCIGCLLLFGIIDGITAGILLLLICIL